jgi:Bacterial PH domain
MVDPVGSTGARSWRIPPAQTAILFLVVTACAALNIYWRPSGPVRIFTILLALAALAWAIVGMRMYLVVDDEGVAVRFIGRESWLPWPEITGIDVVSGVRGANTIRFTRADGTHVDVPPSLLQPAKPTKKPIAIARLKSVAAELQLRRSRA